MGEPVIEQHEYIENTKTGWCSVCKQPDRHPSHAIIPTFEDVINDRDFFVSHEFQGGTDVPCKVCNRRYDDHITHMGRPPFVYPQEMAIPTEPGHYWMHRKTWFDRRDYPVMVRVFTDKDESGDILLVVYEDALRPLSYLYDPGTWFIGPIERPTFKNLEATHV